MAYRALYRVYRPAAFHEVAGQNHITDVLISQVKLGHMAHAYLFCGPRGTGKTTTARILARVANCEYPVNGEPCGECGMCRIMARETADIVEIDAASNNGVDNIRELIEQVRYVPLELKKRVFIIDEVHMLSGPAFNALLKTLEEPPEHALFILATTELQKLPATIISRCQRFDFKRLTIADITGYLEGVLEKEQVRFEPDALRLIAHAAQGGMRDALSLTNQCLSVVPGSLTAETVRSVFGTAEEDFLFRLTDRVIAGDRRGCLDAVEEISRQGRDMTVFCTDLIDHVRGLLLTKSCGRCADLLECTEETAEAYEKQAKGVGEERLLYMAEQLVSARVNMRFVPNPRFLLESTLLRLVCPSEDRSAEALMARISALEERKPVVYAAPAETPAVKAAPPVAQASPAEEAPPWDDGFMPAPPPEDPGASFGEPEPEPAPQPARQPERAEAPAMKAAPAPAAQAPAPAAAAVPAPVRTEGSALLMQLKESLKRNNPMLAMQLRYIDSAKLDGERLLLFYDPVAGKKAESLARGAYLRTLQQALDQVQPNLTVSVLEKKAEPLSPSEQRLKDFFGDKFRIEE